MSQSDAWQQVISLASEWDEQAKELDGLDKSEPLLAAGDKRVASTLRTCANALRFRANAAAGQ